MGLSISARARPLSKSESPAANSMQHVENADLQTTRIASGTNLTLHAKKLISRKLILFAQMRCVS